MLARNSGGEAADEPLISPQPRKDAANLTQPSPSPDMQSAVSLGKWGSKLWKGLKKTLQPKVGNLLSLHQTHTKLVQVPSNLSDPATIMVKVQVGEPSHDQWRKVGMLIDSGSDTDVISEKILRDVLGMSMRPLEESQLQGFRLANCQNVDIKGYVDLTWYAKRGRRRHETRFFVPDMEDPNFELILGVNTSTKLGFLYFSIAALKAIHPKPSARMYLRLWTISNLLTPVRPDELQEESLRKRKHEEKQAENKTLLAEACKRLSSQAPTANKSANTDAKDASA